MLISGKHRAFGGYLCCLTTLCKIFFQIYSLHLTSYSLLRIHLHFINNLKNVEILGIYTITTWKCLPSLTLKCGQCGIKYLNKTPLKPLINFSLNFVGI